ncbi:8-amino-3,8-dideoxy-alpha-D-manno-octulosonate transaminase [Aquimarina sp. EL_43]|uniref:DegT/DnrJ/EryC1/StrS family aminotransferase n=1 Tax=unclassified Aquimarina TaxID=2627091 RepID=UPI0018C97053|nr:MULTISPECIES: DegT/DnrJ/EryC1/StrS family aminotransferase [unclassified Aquimarina]MBG6130592.1 8-amino-3,8-dideoxy-alpha-D-manno-octulosonate transaminase [Aquimarina sp. EL_35]MBG6151262.1 8-amino-3,8-dideoxy-alpha-D-manno-octulosonate transaminase [Aquimarina sp. EL_32]MBG6168994.1 8-amino-3,8-dideoxy-alpha-D-manno-octulosonate transaminase [Aquimarina sp. EL_43]
MPGFELFGAEEQKEVQDVLDNGVLMRYGFDPMRNGHYKALELERDLANRMQSKYAQVVSSGTAALTVALACAGIGSGDEVIMPTFTFVASFEAILSVGAIPVLCDIDDTLTLDPKAVEASITPKTKAIMPVHMCGSMADLGALKAISDKHNLILLEDACQAIGATYDGKPLGSYGDLGCFSFDYVKTITCGEGGGIITNSETFADRAHKYQDHGHDHVGNDRGAETHPFLGYNYRLSELNAAVGIAQLRKLDHTLTIQEKNYTILRNALAEVPEVSFRRVPETGVENYSFLNIFLPTEDIARKAHKALGENGVDACFYWFDNNWHYYKKWEHLLEQKSLSKFSQEIQSGLQKNNRPFDASDLWMGRTISCLIKLNWSETEVANRASKMVEALKGVLVKSVL